MTTFPPTPTAGQLLALMVATLLVVAGLGWLALDAYPACEPVPTGAPRYYRV